MKVRLHGKIPQVTARAARAACRAMERVLGPCADLAVHLVPAAVVACDRESLQCGFGVFCYDDSPKRPPRIYLGARLEPIGREHGMSPADCRAWLIENLAHELAHYERWRAGGEPSERGVALRQDPIAQSGVDMIGATRKGPTTLVRWTPMRYHPDQFAVRHSTKRGVIMDCGRRSGKTELAKRILVKRLRDRIPGCRKPRYICAAPTQEQAVEIFWEDLLELIPDKWIAGGKRGPNVSYSRFRIKLRNGSSVRVVGLDKPHRIEGKYCNGFVGDEWSDVRDGVFDRVIRPMLADFHGWYILCGVPKRQGVGARWYRNLCDRVTATAARQAAGLPPHKDDYPDCGRWTWPSWDIVDPKEIAEARATMDPRDFEEQYGAKWVNAGGGVWHAFTREFNCRQCQRRDNLPIIVGQDYNRTPMCWTLNHRIGEIFEAFDELILTNTDTEHALDELWRRYGHHPGGWQFYGDASARNKGTRKFSDYAIVWNDQRFQAAPGGRTLHYPPANPSLDDRFAAGNARLATADGQHRAFIDPKCAALIEDLEMRAYQPGTMKLPENEGGRGHISDAWSYPIYRIWPIRFNMRGSMKQSVIVPERRGSEAGGGGIGTAGEMAW